MQNPNTPTKRSPEQLIRDLLDALQKLDSDRARACLAENFERLGGPNWKPIGREAYIDMNVRFERAFPDYKWEIVNVISSDRHIAIESVEAGTFSQPWDTGGIVIQPTGTAYTDRSCVFIDLNDEGLISAYRYFSGGEFGIAYAAALQPLMSGPWNQV